MFINDEIQKQVLPVLAKATAGSQTDAQQRGSALLQLNPGQQVTAEIVANLPNSLYMARIAGDMYKLEIPLNVQPGETLELTLVSAEPRIIFQALRPDGASTSVKLSSMGKWLSEVVNDAPSLPVTRETLLESPAQASTLLASKLKAALTQTGLFYESHLARWAAGGVQLKEILKEPQGKLSRVLLDNAGDEAEGTGESGAAGFADSRTLPLIKEQLLLLNAGVLSWQGEAWPGQGMELTISEGDAQPLEEGVEATLSLALPHLGGVEAKLSFGVDGLGVEFVCSRPGASELLKGGGDELRSALISCGLHLTKMAVKDGETAE